ncbi:hypothetical protein [Streptomyces sp. NBC_00989]|uniref:hypothetical protein n=1 Tax=Streptomyces sp. NBC_00989 TaxID=2903705 RepID=UPI003869537D|nr:hypothetical protein OG714_34430 [Streptomyces sp. NBC_00989]
MTAYPSPPASYDSSETESPAPPKGTHLEALGFSWTPPKGWKRTEDETSVRYTSPADTQQIVASVTQDFGDLFPTWQAANASLRGKNDHHLIRLGQTDFQGYPAATWEYTYTSRGIGLLVIDFGFSDGARTYEINTTYHESLGRGARATYDKVVDSFTPW